MKKDLLTLRDITLPELNEIFALASKLKAERGKVSFTPLTGKSIGLIFAKSSTRTRVSFEVGVGELGGRPLYLDQSKMQVGRGETVADTAKVLSRYLHGIVIRTFSHADVEELAREATIPVINALTDDYHPCQIIADLLTIREYSGRVDGSIRMAFYGDGRSNIANSLMLAARLTGIPAGLPLLATGSDKGCETIGLSVIREDQAALSFGTSCTVQFTSKKYFEPTPFMPAYPAVPNDMYNPEIQILRGYWMLTWFKQNFAQAEVEAAKALGCSAEEILNKHLADIPAGSDGLLVLPHWTPGLSTPNTRGAMIGFTDHHTKYHMYRAIIEGLNFALMDGMYGMERRSGQKIRHLYLGGGGSRGIRRNLHSSVPVARSVGVFKKGILRCLR